MVAGTYGPQTGETIWAPPPAFLALGEKKGYRRFGAYRCGLNLLVIQADIEQLFAFERIEAMARFKSVNALEFVRV